MSNAGNGMRWMEPREVFRKLEIDKQQRIFDAAIEEFADQGYKQASVNRMVQKIGIAKGSIFQYFGTKEGLFGFIFDQAVELVRRSLRQVKRETAEADFFERIRRSLIQGIRFIDEHPRVYQVYLKMIFQEDFPLRAQFLQKVHLFSAEYLQPMVESGMARGELRGDLDVKTTVFFLDALMDRFLQAYSVSFLDAGAGFYRASSREIERRVDELVNLLRHGLASGHQP
ncbi:MAG: TetR/AcrR family transcriptional regulator [Syntrophobacteraceae bacterium]|nr:TetR/AcrR family transcriptional regulator [Syntrophobacteraceae bacterium]